MKIIKLTKGYETQVDDEDYGLCMTKSWAATVKYYKGEQTGVYAVRGLVKPNGVRSTEPMHRFILGITDPKVKVDHKDRNSLNNQKYNLRVATDTQSMQNRGKPRHNTSGYIGVMYERRTDKWRAAINVHRKHIGLGNFFTKKEAAIAYDKAALYYGGEFAVTNFPKDNYVNIEPPKLVLRKTKEKQ